LYKVRGLDFAGGSGWETVSLFNFGERNDINASVIRRNRSSTAKSYRTMGDNLIIYPQDAAVGTYQLWYIPRYTPLVADGDVLGNVLDFEEYIVIDAALKCMVKSESDVSALMALNKK
jgi:hypothetical protein